MRAGPGLEADSKGSLSVKSGGTATSFRDAIVGENEDSEGTVTVDGAGSFLIVLGDLKTANKGKATTTVSNGGLITANNMLLAVQNGAQGRLEAKGENAVVRADSNVEASAGENGGTATIAVFDGGIVSSTGASVLLRGATTVEGNSQVAAASQIQSSANSVTIAPGPEGGGVATLTFATPSFSATSGMTLEIDAPLVNYNDRLHVTGSAALGGVVDLNLGFDPLPWMNEGASGDFIRVLSAEGSLTGSVGANFRASAHFGLSWQDGSLALLCFEW